MLATGNTMTRYEYESMEKSKNKDTIELFKIYKPLKHLVYDYGDFSSYILLYNDSLKFAFEPVEFFGWTNITKSEFININGIPHIVALTNTEKGDTANRVITLCDLQGNIMKQLPMPHDFTEIYTGNGKIVFKGEESLFVYSDRLEIIEQISDITESAGFFDINGDRTREFIAFRKSELTAFSPEFDISLHSKLTRNLPLILRKTGSACFKLATGRVLFSIPACFIIFSATAKTNMLYSNILSTWLCFPFGTGCFFLS
jgi:hypothetical protein